MTTNEQNSKRLLKLIEEVGANTFFTDVYRKQCDLPIVICEEFWPNREESLTKWNLFEICMNALENFTVDELKVFLKYVKFSDDTMESVLYTINCDIEKTKLVLETHNLTPKMINDPKYVNKTYISWVVVGQCDEVFKWLVDNEMTAFLGDKQYAPDPIRDEHTICDILCYTLRWGNVEMFEHLMSKGHKPKSFMVKEYGIQKEDVPEYHILTFMIKVYNDWEEHISRSEWNTFTKGQWKETMFKVLELDPTFTLKKFIDEMDFDALAY